MRRAVPYEIICFEYLILLPMKSNKWNFRSDGREYRADGVSCSLATSFCALMMLSASYFHFVHFSLLSSYQRSSLLSPESKFFWLATMMHTHTHTHIHLVPCLLSSYKILILITQFDDKTYTKFQHRLAKMRTLRFKETHKQMLNNFYTFYSAKIPARAFVYRGYLHSAIESMECLVIIGMRVAK